MNILIDDRIQDYSPDEIALWMDELPDWRRRQALAYKHDAGRRQSLLAYRLLCQGLREAYGIAEPPAFLYGEHGKPHIIIKNEVAPHFSLSHCREAVACAISDQPVGIDIEATERNITDSLIRRTMNSEEQALIRQSTAPVRTFLRLWTRKEAVGKLLGTGIEMNRMDKLLCSEQYLIETNETERYIVSTARLR